ncbi:MAG: hypothetical protein L0K43_09055, partial [Bifidobacterium crudilactis]|nr:hypothetical protein [Bifidobacterium crudilactis]
MSPPSAAPGADAHQRPKPTAALSMSRWIWYSILPGTSGKHPNFRSGKNTRSFTSHPGSRCLGAVYLPPSEDLSSEVEAWYCRMTGGAYEDIHSFNESSEDV